MSRASLLLLLAAACGSDTPPVISHSVPPGPPPPAPRVATPWQTRCIAALEQLRIDAAVFEPELRTAEVKIDDYREEVILSAGPPIWHIPSIHIFVVHESKPEEKDWQRFAEPFHGTDHITIMRTTKTVDAAILLDGWETQRAMRLEPTLQRGVDACL